ncbi:hypothetical protein SAMN02745121_08944 [Nannocystis exedens]|uniref:Uncharacterized protein n=1 Tax=Nannocystis exedens TaxID=54 RepID=A0A1I2IRW0_9BACT|nr:hypothetical protein [Nannocystis exedens]PCC69453.1 hypothetical protein NAEX_02475 [Nannocystis exedens]SFF45142.1 hypothetical protein SAMN02745121_08944 [Nannocystis exedens]
MWGATAASTSRSGPDGELVVGGGFSGDLDLGAGPLVGDHSLFVHRLSP